MPTIEPTPQQGSSAFVVSVAGPDRPGIISAVTGILAELAGTLEESSLTVLRGVLSWTVVVTASATVEILEAALVDLTRDGLQVSVVATSEDQIDVRANSFTLSAHGESFDCGAERADIVSGLTAVLASYHGNVVDLTTHSGADSDLVVAALELPVTVNLAQLELDLDATAARLGVEVSLRQSP
jgi:glycine cleavage system transcriptional repressor